MNRCNFRTGECVCNTGWGGFECQIECPKNCEGIKEVNSHVKCMVNPDPEAYTDFCECIYGYLGWNCLDECPGLVEVQLFFIIVVVHFYADIFAFVLLPIG